MTNIPSIGMNHHTVSVFSQMQESGTQNQTPYVGMPVTLNYYTDRRAATVTEVDGKTIKVRFNKVETIDYYAGEYKVLPEMEGGELIFTKRKNGRWVKQGDSAQKGLGLSLGIHAHYVDPHF